MKKTLSIQDHIELFLFHKIKLFYGAIWKVRVYPLVDQQSTLVHNQH